MLCFNAIHVHFVKCQENWLILKTVTVFILIKMKDKKERQNMKKKKLRRPNQRERRKRRSPIIGSKEHFEISS